MGDNLRATGRLSVAILASRVLGLVREVVFASLIGAGAIADAFHVAFRIPNLLRDLLAEGALSSAFVPTFTASLRGEGPQEAYRLGNLALTAMLMVTGALTAAGILFAEPIVVLISNGFGGDPAKVELAASLTRVMMPILSLVSLGAVWMGMLNAQRRFVTPAIAPAVFNVVSLAVGVVLLALEQDVGTAVLAWSYGTLAAGAVQALMQLAALMRLGYRPWISVRNLWSHPGIRRIARLMAPAMVGLAAIQINVFVNTRFAGSLHDGAVAELNYAFRLFFLPLGMFGVALGTVTTTSVSEAAAGGDHRELARRATESVLAGLMLTSASAVGMFVLADPLVELIYRHGETSRDSADAIAMVLQAYVLGLVPYSLIKILAPAFYSVDKPRVPLLASAFGVVVNITFNALTYRTLGTPGIALGTALGAAANITLLRIMFGRAIAPMQVLTARRLGALVLANAGMGALVWASWWGWQRALDASGLQLGGWARLLDAASLAVVVAIGFFSFAGVARALRYPQADALWAMPQKIVARLRRR